MPFSRTWRKIASPFIKITMKNSFSAVLVANSSEARFFVYDHVEKSLTELEDFFSPPTILSDIKESADGLGDQDNRQKRHALERFSVYVAAEIFQYINTHKNCASFFLVAPDKIAHELKGHFHSYVQALPTTELNENLVHLSGHELKKHLERHGLIA